MDWLIGFFSAIGKAVIASLINIGRYARLVWGACYWTVHRPIRVKLIFKQLEFVGNKSLGIVFLSSLFTGGVLALQIGPIVSVLYAVLFRNGVRIKLECKSLSGRVGVLAASR